MDKVKICMIGGGLDSMIGSHHRIGAQQSAYFALVAGCFSQTLAKTIKLAEMIGISSSRCYEQWQEMIKQESLREDGARAVIIATPDPLHYEQAKYALSHGMHVICDKPVTITSEEAYDLWRLAYEKDLLLGVTYTLNGTTAIRDSKEILQAGKIGDVRAVIVKKIASLGTELIENNPEHPSHKFAWRFKNDYGNAGAISDIGSHMFQYLNYILDQLPIEINASLTTIVKGRQSDDTSFITLKYKNNVMASMFLSLAGVPLDESFYIEILGSKGSLKLAEGANSGYTIKLNSNDTSDRVEKIYLSKTGLVKEYEKSCIPNAGALNFKNLYTQFGKAIVEQKCRDYDAYISIKHGYWGMEIIEKAQQSSKNKTWMNLEYKSVY